MEGRTSARARFLPLRASCCPRPAPGCRMLTPIVAAASSTVMVQIRHQAAQLLWAQSCLRSADIACVGVGRHAAFGACAQQRGETRTGHQTDADTARMRKRKKGRTSTGGSWPEMAHTCSEAGLQPSTHMDAVRSARQFMKCAVLRRCCDRLLLSPKRRAAHDGCALTIRRPTAVSATPRGEEAGKHVAFAWDLGVDPCTSTVSLSVPTG